MKKTVFAILLLIVITLQGCLVSVHPLFTKDQSYIKESLFGKWQSGDDVWHFKRLSELEDITEDKTAEEMFTNSHIVIFSHKNDTVVFAAKVGKLGKHEFMDLYPIVHELTSSSFVNLHFYAMHTFHRIELNDDNLSLYMVKESFVKDLLGKKKIKIKHEQSDDKFVLTASTSEIQKFFIKYGETEDAYDKPRVLSKVE